MPRLTAAGADLQCISFLKIIRQDEKRRMFLLAEDLDALAQVIAETQAVMITIDPITAFMGKINAHMSTDVRDQLGPLADLAERTNVVISAITHPPKAAGAKAIDHYIGSQAYIAAARIGHLCVPEMMSDSDGDLKKTGRVFVTNPKNNLSPAMPTLIYRTEQTVIGEDRSEQIEVPFTDWCGDSDLTADEAIAATKTSSRTLKVDQFLRSFLADGPKTEREVMKAAKAQGFTKDQVKRARSRVGIKSEKLGFGDGWRWSLRKRA